MTDYTDEILAAADVETHSPVSDTDEAIIVNTDTRDFTLGPNFAPIVGVTGDHNSEIVSFAIDKFIENHDIAGCSEHKVFWENKEAKTSGECVITDIKDSQDKEGTILLGWKLDEEVTSKAGTISFALQISDYNDAGDLVYRWQAVGGDGLIILQGPNHEEYPAAIKKSFVSLVDQTTGETVRLYVSDGKLTMKESEE